MALVTYRGRTLHTESIHIDHSRFQIQLQMRPTFYFLIMQSVTHHIFSLVEIVTPKHYRDFIRVIRPVVMVLFT